MIFVFFVFCFSAFAFLEESCLHIPKLSKHWLQLRACWRYLTRIKGRRRYFFYPVGDFLQDLCWNLIVAATVC